MRRFMMAAAMASAFAASDAVAQTGGAEEVRRTYFAIGVEAGGEFDFCDEDDDCSDGGLGAFGRIGYRANRFLGAEADLGLATISRSNGSFAHVAALGVVTLPIGPVEFRARGGPAVFSAEGEGRLGVAVGPGVGVRFGKRSAVRADVLVFVGEDDSTTDAGGLLQVGFERRF